MQKFTRTQFTALELAMQNQYEIDNVAQKFNVTPNAAQKIIAAAREENDFLSKINVELVVDQSGEAIRLNATGMIAKTTNTDNNDRQPTNPMTLGGTPYDCKKIDFDTYIKYQTLDSWAHKPNFKTLVAKQTRHQINTNMIQIGFYGEQRVADSNPVVNPLGQDVAKGWLKKIEEQAPGQFVTEYGTANEIRIGENGDFINLDGIVNDLAELIEPEHQGAGDLVVIIGSELLSADKAKFYEVHGNTPSEKAKIEEKQVIGTYGSLPAFKIPFFPPRGILITSFDNLSIYIQKDSIRKMMVDKPERDRIVNFHSQNMDYVIEELGKVATVKHQNVKLSDDGGTTWS